MRVLLVEDSRVMQLYLQTLLTTADGIELVGTAVDGFEAVELAKRLRPDIILMDLQLPGQSGLHATADIMAVAPALIIVLSALLKPSQCALTFEALRLGAIDVLRKPTGATPKAINEFRSKLMRTMTELMGANIAKRTLRPRPEVAREGLVPTAPTSTDGRNAGSRRGPPEVVAIGASTGGPVVVQNLLTTVTPPLPMCTLLTQHITPGFEEGYVRWLRRTGHDVRVATDGVTLAPGILWVSPADRHMVVRDGGRVALLPAAARWPCPSVDALFESVATVFGGRALGVLLTGMGRDGAKGLFAMRNAGARTIAQSGDSCVVNGMPQAAVALDAVEELLDPPAIAIKLQEIAANARQNRN